MTRSRQGISLVLSILLAFGAVFILPPFGARAQDQDVSARIDLESMCVFIDDSLIYEYGETVEEPTVKLKENSTLSFELDWDANDGGSGFREGDSFSVPIVRVENLWLTKKFETPLAINGVNVAKGCFTYRGDLLSFEVTFNENAEKYSINGGQADGYARFMLNEDSDELEFTFDDGQSLVVKVEHDEYDFSANISGNLRKGDVLILKLDAEDWASGSGAVSESDIADKKGLEGARFQVFEEGDDTTPLLFQRDADSGFYNCEDTGDADVQTDENGMLVLSGLRSGETYLLKEVQAPQGYQAGGSIRIEADHSKKAYYIVTNNKTPETKARNMAVYKVDSKTGAYLQDATFRLVYPDGSEKTGVTNSGGLAEFPLDKDDYAGTYTIKEITAPSGYVLNSQETQFRIRDDYTTELTGSYTHVQRVDEAYLVIENTRESTPSTETPKDDDTTSSRPDRDTSGGAGPDKPPVREKTTQTPAKPTAQKSEAAPRQIADEPVPLASAPTTHNPDTGVKTGLGIAAALALLSGAYALLRKGKH